MKSAVRQMRGPGMNLGLKKPRKKAADPKPYVQSRAMKKATKADAPSYLPDEKPAKAARVSKLRTRRAGKVSSSSKLF